MQSEKTNLTRRGVCKNLEFSPYNYTYTYKDIVVTFNFSSKLHLSNFSNQRMNNYSMVYNSIKKRFKFAIDCTFLSDFNLYRKIETRGCYINYGGKIFTSIKDITLD